MNGPEHEPHGGSQPEELPRPPADDLLARAMPEAVDATPGRPTEPGEEMPGQPEDREADDDRPQPRIYVASLSDYNAGRLHGRWIDADQPLDNLWSDIGDMLAESPERGAEEWAIHDYEGFWPLELHEYEPLEFVQQVAEGIAQHGEAFAALVEVAERDPDRLPFFEDMYRGAWASVEAYAEHLLEELGVDEQLARLPEWVRPYVVIDTQALARELGGSSVMATPTSDGQVHVFDFEAVS